MAFSAREVSVEPELARLLASDTRIRILKQLADRKMTVSELSRAMDLNKSTLHEHLTKLVGGGFVLKIESAERQWVYYQLTARAEGVVRPDDARSYSLPPVWPLVSILVVVLAAVVATTMVYPSAPPNFSVSVHPTSTSTPVAGEIVTYQVTVPSTATVRRIEILDGPDPQLARIVATPSVQRGGELLSFRQGLQGGISYVHVVMVEGHASPVPIRVSPIEIQGLPAGLVAGVENPEPHSLTLTAAGAPVHGGVVFVPHSEILDAVVPLTSVDAQGRVDLRLAPKAAGTIPLAYRSPGSAVVVPLASIVVQAPIVRTIPDRLVVGEDNRLVIVVMQPLGGAMAGVAVRLLDENGVPANVAITDHEGRAVFQVRPSGVGEISVQVGSGPRTGVGAGDRAVEFSTIAPQASVSALGPNSIPSRFAAFVRNAGGSPVREQVLFKVDGRVVERQGVELSQGEGRLVVFEHRLNDGASHTVAISGMPPVDVRPHSAIVVVDAGSAGLPSVGMAIIEGTLAGVGVVTVLALRRAGRLW